MVYQPIYDLGTGRVVGSEALARLQAAEPYQPPDVWFSRAAIVGREIELETCAIQLALQALTRSLRRSTSPSMPHLRPSSWVSSARR